MYGKQGAPVVASDMRHLLTSFVSRCFGAELLHLTALHGPPGHRIGGGGERRRTILGQRVIALSPKIVQPPR